MNEKEDEPATTVRESALSRKESDPIKVESQHFDDLPEIEDDYPDFNDGKQQEIFRLARSEAE